ncbi:MAG: NAD-dependent epimerase/dehydratase family protein [Candidatus Aminicenantes bacterium]|nr:NAD-dependent epimerase/dehydratase family protein [Candidatus Aminicenantes bacterium]
MKSSILITGASGFVGKTLIGKLELSEFNKVYLLVPEQDVPDALKKLGKNVVILHGDITDPEVHKIIPDNINILLHMAAITGKAAKAEYEKVNFEAFKDIVISGKQKGLEKVLFISTIAVKFSKRNRYFYSFSKEKAEQFLDGSGMEYSILRPTMILGSGSPVFKGFSMFAGLPLIPLFGGGKAIVQPVHLDDVCSTIIQILTKSIFKGDTYDIGGPDKLSIREFLKKISELKGKRPKFLSIPMWIPVSIISVLDRIIYSFLPLTLGQLATFRNDSVAEDNIILKELSGGFSDINAMIKDSVQGELDGQKYYRAVRECRVFTKYLIGKKSTAYNEKKYVEFLSKTDTTHLNGFDKFLSGLAVKSPLFTKICDAYSRFFFQHSLLRKKLGTLFAILETSPVTYRYIDDIGSKNIFTILINLGFRGAWFAFHLFVSILFFLPLQILTGRGGNKQQKGEGRE